MLLFNFILRNLGGILPAPTIVFATVYLWVTARHILTKHQNVITPSLIFYCARYSPISTAIGCYSNGITSRETRALTKDTTNTTIFQPLSQCSLSATSLYLKTARLVVRLCCTSQNNFGESSYSWDYLMSTAWPHQFYWYPKQTRNCAEVKITPG